MRACDIILSLLDSARLLSRETEKPAFAAIKLEDGRIFTGFNHADAFQKAVSNGFIHYNTRYSRGFITNLKRFVSIDQAGS